MDGKSACLCLFHRGLQSELCELHVKADQFKFSKFGTRLHVYVDLLFGVCGRMRVGIASDGRKYVTI